MQNFQSLIICISLHKWCNIYFFFGLTDDYQYGENAGIDYIGSKLESVNMGIFFHQYLWLKFCINKAFTNNVQIKRKYLFKYAGSSFSAVNQPQRKSLQLKRHCFKDVSVSLF